MSNILNVEIKAKCQNPSAIREILKANNADYKGIDSQTDTYFNCDNGLLKLREGNIENSLIFYKRQNKSGPKESDIALSKMKPENGIKDVLTKALGIFIKVKKSREIYYINNIKFHIDHLDNLGDFVEIEAIGTNGTYSKEELEDQCKHYMQLFNILPEDLVTHSYSDLLKN